MGQKVNPKTFRLGVLHSWSSRWFADDSQYKNFVLEDAKLRKNLFKKLSGAGLTSVEIERSINKITIILQVVRPGVVIGRGGSGLEALKKFIQQIIASKKNVKLDLRVEPVKEPYLSAHFVAQQIAEQLAKRLPHKRVVSQAIEKVKTAGAKGVKITLSGRIGGAEIARRETYKMGTIPLSTIREEIDFAEMPSLTKSGYIGVKVWICR